jgi:hypothetical protein
LKVTREKYGKPRSQVEKKILEFNEKVMDDERKYREHIQSEREKKKTKNS